MRSREELKSIIRKVWEKVLSKQNITDHDKFADLGGDASILIDVVYQLEIELQMELPVEVLLMMVTVEEMAFAIDFLNKEEFVESKYLSSDQLIKLKMSMASLGEFSEEKSLVVKINEKGNLPPIFWCFNSPNQETMALSEKLSKDQPLYALMSSVTLGKSQEILEKLASHYVDEIIRLYPEGPYHLGGNCRGAKVMCEIVFQLQKQGKHIEKLCLLEFFHPKLYDFSGKLMLLFGKTSEYQRHKLLNWGEEGWKDSFSKVPTVFFIPCGHGEFFREENIDHLKKQVNQFFNKK
jgi:thioesterase domain-containing protein/acyl carrier protein